MQDPSSLHLGAVIVDGHSLGKTVCRDCCEVVGNEFRLASSGVYNITEFCGDDATVVEAYCDAGTDGGGWLVIQDGSVDFNKYWVDYEDGFGSLTGEFWYGLRAIHCLTSQRQWQLHIDYVTVDCRKGYLSYSTFRVGSAAENYKLTISGFSGSTRDPISTHTLNGMASTTRDRDNDLVFGRNCVTDRVGNAGGWWHNVCSHFMLNSKYNNTYLYNKWNALRFTEIKIRAETNIKFYNSNIFSN